jgi:hypothetical protein
VLAYDYPLLAVFWTTFLVAIWVAWIMLLFHVLADIFRTHTGGASKALWSVIVIAVPFFGVVAYLVTHANSMGERDYERLEAHSGPYATSVRKAAVAGPNAADELAAFADLRARGLITDQELAEQQRLIVPDASTAP